MGTSPWKRQSETGAALIVGGLDGAQVASQIAKEATSEVEPQAHAGDGSVLVAGSTAEAFEDRFPFVLRNARTEISDEDGVDLFRCLPADLEPAAFDGVLACVFQDVQERLDERATVEPACEVGGKEGDVERETVPFREGTEEVHGF